MLGANDISVSIRKRKENGGILSKTPRKFKFAYKCDTQQQPASTLVNIL